MRFDWTRVRPPAAPLLTFFLMHNQKKFNPANLLRLNNPERLLDLPSEHLFNFLNLKNPKLAIDIGAGTGFYSVRIPQFFQGCKVIACDISSEMIGWIEENLKVDNPLISTLLMSENEVNLDDEIADFIIMINLHHELDNPSVMLKECYRLLKKGGKLLISDWKKIETPSGPPLNIRRHAHEVVAELDDASYVNIVIDESLKNNYIVVGEK